MKKKYELKVNANSKAFVVGGAGFSVEVLDRLENVLVSTVYPGSKYRKYRGISANIKGENHKSMEVKKKKVSEKETIFVYGTLGPVYSDKEKRNFTFKEVKHVV